MILEMKSGEKIECAKVLQADLEKQICVVEFDEALPTKVGQKKQRAFNIHKLTPESRELALKAAAPKAE